LKWIPKDILRKLQVRLVIETISNQSKTPWFYLSRSSWLSALIFAFQMFKFQTNKFFWRAKLFVEELSWNCYFFSSRNFLRTEKKKGLLYLTNNYSANALSFLQTRTLLLTHPAHTKVKWSEVRERERERERERDGLSVRVCFAWGSKKRKKWSLKAFFLRRSQSQTLKGIRRTDLLKQNTKKKSRQRLVALNWIKTV
jgi:hypothetical protein